MINYDKMFIVDLPVAKEFCYYAIYYLSKNSRIVAFHFSFAS